MFTAVNEIIARVHQRDLELEKDKLEEDRAKRKELRDMADRGEQLTAGELMAKLTGEDKKAPEEEQQADAPSEPKHEERSGFPPPPTFRNRSAT